MSFIFLYLVYSFSGKIMNFKLMPLYLFLLIISLNAQTADTTIILPGGAIDQLIWHNKDYWDATKSIYFRIDQRHPEAGNYNGSTSYIRYYFKELKADFERKRPDIEVHFSTDSLKYYPDLIVDINFMNFKNGTEDETYNVWTGTRYATVHVKMAAYVQNTDKKVFDLEHTTVNVLNSQVLRHDSKNGLFKLLISRNTDDVSNFLLKKKDNNHALNIFRKIPIERKDMVSVIFYNGETAKGYYLGEDDRYLYYRENDNSQKVSLLKSVITNYEIIKN